VSSFVDPWKIALKYYSEACAWALHCYNVFNGGSQNKTSHCQGNVSHLLPQQRFHPFNSKANTAKEAKQILSPTI